MAVFEGNLETSGKRFAIVASRFNDFVVEKLVSGALGMLSKLGVPDDSVDVYWVPGAYEIPHAARALAESGRYDAVVTLGSVIQGGTPHFDFVCQGVTDGVREVVRDTGVPVAFGVLTTHTIDQAFERTGTEANKGAEVAAAAVEMARLCQRLASPPGGVGTP